MEPRTNPLSSAFGIGLLTVSFLLSAFWLSRVEWERVLVSSVMEFLPAKGGGDLEVAASMRESQSKLVYFGGDGAALSAPAAQALSTALGALPGVADHGVGVLPRGLEDLGRVVLEERVDLFFPTWLAAAQDRYRSEAGANSFPSWLAEAVVAELETFFDSPESLGFESLVEDDPLLLFRLAWAQLETEEPPDSMGPATVVWVELADDPMDAAVQSRLIPALEGGINAYLEGFPEESVRWFGALRFAEETRREIRREIGLLNLLTLLAISLIALFVLRRPWQLGHLLVPVVFGFLGGITVLTLSFDRVHLLALVMGSMLGGVAIDYGVHLFFHARGGAGDRLVFRSLLISGGSSIAGFAIWAGSSLVVAQQTGVFLASGLASALIAGLIYPPLRQPAALRGERFLGRRLLPRAASLRGALLAAVVGLSGFGWLRLDWNDSVAVLDIPHPELDETVGMITTQAGGDQTNEILFATGRDFVDAAERLARLEDPGFTLIGWFPRTDGLAAVEAFSSQWPVFQTALVSTLEARDFDPAAFDPFFASMNRRFAIASPAEAWRDRLNDVGESVEELFVGPSSLLLGSIGTHYWMSALRATPPKGAPTVPAGIGRLAIREDLERLIGDWRREQVQFSLLGILAIAVIIGFALPRKIWLSTFGLPVGAVVAALGIVGWAMGGLNLFHLAGALLGFCVSLDFVVFFENSRMAGKAFPSSIRFSAMTTAVAFALLLLSQVPAVRALGGTVALSVILAIFGLEMLRFRSAVNPHA